MQELLIIASCPKECPSEIWGPNMVFYTGIGKVDAAIVTTQVILDQKPDLIINFGTAGSYDEKLTGLIECGIFEDLDDDEGYNEIIITDPGKERLHTSNSFVTSGNGSGLVDMEAYSIAKACYIFGVDFKCFKFVTDYVNHNSREEWANKISDGIDAYKKVLDDYQQNPI
jgi:adenosylhomocysteine nucleosidase